MKKYLLLLALPLALCFTACGDDEDKDSPGSNKTVVIDDEGKASNGALFSAIDDQNFYLDYIKYTVVDGHLVVSGYDKTGFKGVAKIVSGISYKGNAYQVLEIGHDDEYGAFRGCSGLTSITIPNSVTSIGYEAFRGCSGLTSVTIPNSVTSIEDYAFRDCSGLTSVTIGNSVTSIGSYAFSGCSGLTSVTIPNSVTSIGGYAFYGCSGLTSIKVESGNTIYDSRDNCNAIIETASNMLVAGCKNTTIPNSVTSIGEGAFQYCSGLTSITIPNSVTSIGGYTFRGCSGLTSVTIPNSVTSIGSSAFQYCSGLTSVTIPNSVTSIGDDAFSGCSGLTSVTIPNSVTYIGAAAFSGCSGLKEVHCKATTPPTLVYYYDDSSFSLTYKSQMTLYVPQGCLEAYNSSGWRKYFNSIVEE